MANLPPAADPTYPKTPTGRHSSNLSSGFSFEKTGSYELLCQVCGHRFKDDGFVLQCPRDHVPSLISTDYAAVRFEPDYSEHGLFRFRRWLPIRESLPEAGKTVTYQSELLCSATRLPNLWISFNGYWPEKGAKLSTTTFKELEAYTVVARTRPSADRVLVIASAGNAAAAFALVCSRLEIGCLIVVPQSAMCRMMFREPISPKVRIVSLPQGADYTDTIALANVVAHLDGFYPEGGVKNVARRDGIGTTMLDAADTIGRLPDFYFQAVGSGTGAIAAHEAAKRLIGDGRFGNKLPQLVLSQNLPFAPMFKAWTSNGQITPVADRASDRKLVSEMIAPVLSNSTPAYALAGGVLAALRESGGYMSAVTNEEALRAANLFEDLEKIDIDPAAGVAVASLLNTVGAGRIPQNAIVLLHITGGGWKRQQYESDAMPLACTHLALASAEASPRTIDKIRQLFPL
jgi:cysteate synthase